MSPHAARIYRRNYVEDSNVEDVIDEVGDVSRVSRCLAVVAVAFAVTAPVAYLLSFGSRLGPRRSRVWVSSLAIATAFVWCVVEPLVIVFWNVFLPSLPAFDDRSCFWS